MRSIVSRCAALLSGAFLLMNSVPAAFAEEPNTIVQKEAHTMQTYRQMLTELAPDAVFARQESVCLPDVSEVHLLFTYGASGYPGQRAAADGLR